MKTPVRVADLTGFDLFDPYFWKSEEQIVLLRHAPGPSAEDAGQFEVVVHDLTTGRNEPLYAFNAAYAPLLRGTIVYNSVEGKPGHWITYTRPPCSLSPDGRWFAALVPRSKPAWLVVPLEPDARQSPQIFDAPDDLDPKPKTVSGVCPIWLPDSRRWVAMINVYDKRQRQHSFPWMVLHDTQDPAAHRTIVITDLRSMVVLGVTTAQRPSGASGEAVVLFDLKRDRDVFRYGVDELALYAVPLNADATPVQAEHWTVALPGRSVLWQVALSPDGNRLAWLSNLPGLSNNAFDSLAFSSWKVWVGGLNGEDTHPIGTMPEAIESLPGRGCLLPNNLAWLPTGRAVSYRYGDALWVANVD